MILIIGGAWQGKLSYAVKTYGLAESDLCDLANGYQPDKRCYYHLESLSQQETTVTFPHNSIVIAREIGSGVVPIDASERIRREAHGVLLQKLAAQADHVIRIFCGLPEVLK